ncbi:S8 family serine peptidase [Undibacterium arcticum]|uniref:S8 family serine peptidase n=1 Tax=Undibacterium arcticum TaxID=1762892 RepID=UPI00360F379E
MLESKVTVSSLGKLTKLCLTAAIVGLAGGAAAGEPQRFIVAYKAGADLNANAAVIRARGNVKLKIHGMNAMSVEMSDQTLQDLRNDPSIDYVEADAIRSLPGVNTMSAAMADQALSLSSAASPSSGKTYFPGQQIPYGIKMVQADQLPNGGARTGNRMVCIIDSGYDLQHEDLNNNGTVTGEYDPGTGWWNADENHHGTHVAGTISALNNNGTGVVGVISSRQLHLHIVKVGADGWAYSSSLVAAANKCASAGANVISMSLGGAEPTLTEANAFAALASKGILSIAAAGNSGNAVLSYPASYPSVMSVAALDENKQHASFSQYNNKVEIAAPGVHVLSTVPMGTGSESTISIAGTTYVAGDMTGSPKATVTAPLADFGIGDAVNAAVAGKICLIERGVIAFGAKVANCQASGGVGAIVYNSLGRGSFGGTLGDTVTAIPSATASAADGAVMRTQLGQSATVKVKATNYAYFDGTSMATPHVSAVAALVWSYFPMCSADQIRTTLDKSAEDLGAPGRDPQYGFGLVRAKDAYDRLATYGCNN